MGAAIDVFDGARALRVPRARFAPVKTTNDLLVAALRRLRADRRRARRARPRAATAPPVVDLDAEHFKLLRDFDARFPRGRAVAASRASASTVEGDVDVRRATSSCAARSTVEHDGDGPLRIEDGTVLEG